MNAADQAIKEIREVRHQISAGFNHDIFKYVAFLKEEQTRHSEQIKRGQDLLQKREAERGYPELTETNIVLNDKPKP